VEIPFGILGCIGVIGVLLFGTGSLRDPVPTFRMTDVEMTDAEKQSLHLHGECRSLICRVAEGGNALLDVEHQIVRAK
jgi:hypothetical protein